MPIETKILIGFYIFVLVLGVFCTIYYLERSVYEKNQKKLIFFVSERKENGIIIIEAKLIMKERSSKDGER